MRSWVRWGLALVPLLLVAIGVGCGNTCLNPQPDLPCDASEVSGTPGGMMGSGGSSNLSAGGENSVGGPGGSGNTATGGASNGGAPSANNPDAGMEEGGAGPETPTGASGEGGMSGDGATGEAGATELGAAGVAGESSLH